MAKKKKWAKPTETQPHQCQFCGTLFAREQTLFSHPCERKRRHLQRDDRWVKLAFSIFERSYRLLRLGQSRKTALCYDDFADSQFYSGFVRFARYLAEQDVTNVEQFNDWLIKEEVKLDDWCRPEVYERYLKHVVETEPVAVAVERNVLFMERWASETGENYADFFRRIAPGEAMSCFGSRFMPTETKNTPRSRPLNGSIVASIARRYSVSASSRPATKAPSVIDRPLAAAVSAVPTMTRRQAAMNSSVERVRATS